MPASGGYVSQGYTITVTSGTLKLYCVIYQVPDYRDVTDQISTVGTWTTAAGFYSPASIKYTDTANDYARLTYEGRSLAMIYQARSASGIITEYIDGVSNTRDLYLNGNYSKLVRFGSSQAFGRRQWAAVYTGTNNASATAPTGANRRFGIIQAFSIRDR